MTTDWNRETYEASITRLCFLATPYDEGWDARWDDKGPVLQEDADMQRLLELEVAIQPVPGWARKVAQQIEEFPPCGWAFPQVVAAICTNIGADGKWGRITPPRCYTVGSDRLRLMADIALCLDGWLKAVSPDAVAAALAQHASDGRDWHTLTRKVDAALGERAPLKILLVRRLLARLRFWLRAPYETLKPDDNPHLGYLYISSMERYGGWDYFSFEDHDPDVIDLEARLRAELDHAGRWLELIQCTWPCAPKVFRYLERLVAAIGAVAVRDAVPPGIHDPLPGDVLQIEGTCLDSVTSYGLFYTALATLGQFTGEVFPIAIPAVVDLDAAFGAHLTSLLGETSPVKCWLAALLAKRIKLLELGARSFHFTRNTQQVL